MRNNWIDSEILRRIERADDLEIGEVIQAVIRRYQKIYPEWEAIFLTIPRNDPEERKRIMEMILSIEQQ